MNKNRREFLKITGIAGLGLAGGGLLGYTRGTADHHDTNLARKIRKYKNQHVQHFNMSGYAAP